MRASLDQLQAYLLSKELFWPVSPQLVSALSPSLPLAACCWQLRFKEPYLPQANLTLRSELKQHSSTARFLRPAINGPLPGKLKPSVNSALGCASGAITSTI